MPGFTTTAVHATVVQANDPLIPSIALSTAFVQPSQNATGGEFGRWEYQRVDNPNRNQVENALAKIEGAERAFVYSSGMGATAAAMNLLKEGETLLLGMPVYGGNYRFASVELPKRGVRTRFMGDFTQLSDEDFAENVTMVFLETPTNPTLRIADIQKIAEITHRNGAILVVDNTFLTPYLQKPLELGADITVQSATKYLGGHNDLLAGVAATNDPVLAEELYNNQFISGNMLSPVDSFRLLQDIKTLALRMNRQIDNTHAVIDYLKSHPAIDRVLYAGWASEEEAEIQARQSKDIGALFSFEFKEGADINAFLGALKVFAFAVSLGGVESLVCLPAAMTQGAIEPEHRQHFDVPDTLIRVAVGIEDPEDLIADLEQALAVAYKG